MVFFPASYYNLPSRPGNTLAYYSPDTQQDPPPHNKFDFEYQHTLQYFLSFDVTDAIVLPDY